jgi:hypothetical protein
MNTGGGHRLVMPALLLAALPAVAAATVTFQHRWCWQLEASGRSVMQSATGGYAVSGGTRSGAALYGMALALADSMGETTRVRHVSGVERASGCACRSLDTGYVVAGTRDTLHLFARKFTSAGDSAWTYTGQVQGLVSAVVATADGGCLIVGRMPNSMADFGAVKLRSDGSEEWSRFYEEPMMFESFARAAAQTSDSGFVLCGDANDYVGSYLRLVRTGPGGESLWARSYHGALNGSLRAVRETPDHGFFAAGFELDTVGYMPALYMMRTSASGNLLWTRQLALPGAATTAAAVCDAWGGGYLLAGTIDWGDSSRAWLVRTDSAGDTIWTRILAGSGFEGAADVIRTDDGGYAIAGFSDSAGASVLFVKTDSLGVIYTVIAEERVSSEARRAREQRTIVRDILYVPSSLFTRRSSARFVLFDLSGREVASLRPGPNDARHLPAGIYFVRMASGVGRDASCPTKLVVTR